MFKRNFIKKTLLSLLTFLLVFTSVPISFTSVTYASGEDDISVSVRIEAHDQTLLPKTELEVSPFDISEFINSGNNGVSSEEVRAIHAIIRALEKIDGFNPKDKNQFVLNYGGNYIAKIGQYGEFTHGQGSGWMYYVNNKYAPVGVGDFKLRDGDSIVLYFVEDFMDSTYSSFEQETYEVSEGEPLTLTLQGAGFNSTSTEGASLLIDEQVYEVDGEPILFDSNGELTVIFEKAGIYTLSAKRLNSGIINLVRPYAKVIVHEKVIELDTTPPEINVKGIEDEQVFTEKQITFTVTAYDDIDGEVTPKIKVNNEEITANSSGLLVANLKNGTNTILITAKDSSGNESQKLITVIYSPETVAKDIQKAIDDVVNYLLTTGVTGEWEAIGLSKAGIEVPSNYLTIFEQNIQNQIKNNLANGRFIITDAERLALAALAIGKDPRDINGTNLIELIYNSPNREMWDGSIEDTMTFQGNNGLAFALIALDAANFKIPKNAKWTREKLVSKLLETQREDGAWNLNDAYPSPSVDITAMVLTALAPYNDKENVKQSIERALNYLEENQVDEGGFDGGAFVGGVTSEATSQVIIALTANGIDPTDERFTKGNDLIDHLLMHQNEDGGFAHTLQYSDSNNMATEQALQALVAYSLFLQEKGSLYKFELEETDDPNGDQNGNENGKEETPKPIIIEDVKKVQNINVEPGQIIKFENSSSQIVLPDNLPEGTKVTISEPHKNKAPKKNDNLKLAGDWFDVTFDYGKGDLPDGAIFTLTLSVDEAISLDDVEIYHLNEENNKWELVKAIKKDKENHTITVEVSHFSIYAVLQKLSEEEKNREEDEKGNSNSGSNHTNNGLGGSNNGGGKTNENNKGNGKNDNNLQDLTDDVTNLVTIDDKTTDSNKKLPNTATNNYNVILIGLLFIIVGIAFITYKRRKISH